MLPAPTPSHIYEYHRWSDLFYTGRREKARTKISYPIFQTSPLTTSCRCKVTRVDKSPLGDTIRLRAQDLSSTSCLSPSSGPGGSKSCVESFGDGDAPPHLTGLSPLSGAPHPIRLLSIFIFSRHFLASRRNSRLSSCKPLVTRFHQLINT